MDTKPLYQVLESSILSHNLTAGGQLLSPKDKERGSRAILLWFSILLELSEKWQLGRDLNPAFLSHWIGRLDEIDLSKLFQALKGFKQNLRLWQPHMGSLSYSGFKTFIRGEVVDELDTWDLVVPFLRRYHHAVRCELVSLAAVAFRDCNTVLSFLDRLTLFDRSDLESKAIEDYVSLENEMEQWQYPSTEIEALRRILFSFQFTWNPECGHGPGATAQCRRGSGIAAKFEACKRNVSNDYFANKIIGFVHPLVENFGDRDPVPVMFVPKGLEQFRTISPENTYDQYLQSVVHSSIDLMFKENRDLHVELDDQSISRQMCLDGSANFRYSTIDLSSASDTVTYSLMKRLLHGHPLQYVFLLRSPFAKLPNGDTIRLHKFTPMGSKMTFGCESLVFALCCLRACETAGCRPDYQVYGDDIIICHEATTALLDLLHDLHFKVNEEKSYLSPSGFLEACGEEAWYGHSVVPLRLSRKIDLSLQGKSDRSGVHQLHTSQLESWISLANDLYEYGLLRTRRLLVRHILAYPIPFSVSGLYGLKHPDPGNQHLRSRRDRSLQASRVKVIDSDSVIMDAPDDVRYILTLEELSKTSRTSLFYPEDRIEVHAGRTPTRMKYSWRDPSFYKTCAFQQ